MKRRSPLLAIYLVVLIDAMGFTMVYPLLPFYAEELGATALQATALVSVYAVCSMIATPVLGRMSDRYGRRRLLVISQAGTLAGFLAMAFANHLWMLYLGRVLDGLTAGNVSVAQAYISDHTRAEARAKAFGMIGIAFGIGYLVAPVAAAWLSTATGEVGTPFLVAAGLSAISMLCSRTLLSDSKVIPAVRPVSRSRSSYLAYLRRPKLRALYLQYFMFAFAYSAFTSGFALFAERRLVTADGAPWTPHEVAYVFAYSGVLGIVFQSGVLGWLVRTLGEARLALVAFAAASIAYVTLGFTYGVVVLVVVYTLTTLANVVLRPVITSQMTMVVERAEQGVTLGIAASLLSLANAVAPLCGGRLLDHRWTLAWAVLAGGATFAGFLIAVASRPRAASRGVNP
ncbi:MAG TPA: MFS transporter [Kofleriaceae bacterium]|nr:MFS transporter [Kofleriaceae bacterium]